MQLTRLTMLQRRKIEWVRTPAAVSFLLFSLLTSAQDNSPYSRYGLGDVFPATNINTRGMGGIAAGYVDGISVNYNNPASYAGFIAAPLAKSRKIASGRAVFDVGISLLNRGLAAPNRVGKFTSTDLLFSHVQVGVPIRKNWGLVFGIRPLTRTSYLVSSREKLPGIDSASTVYSGSGGSYLPTIGTGFAIKNLSIGANIGYLFGTKNTGTRRLLLNDSTVYAPVYYTDSSSFGGLFFNAGLQYKIQLNKNTLIRLGVSGNTQQKLNGRQDRTRETYYIGVAGEMVQVDSIFKQADVKGKVVYPASYRAGFVLQRNNDDFSGWLIGADYIQNKWSNYRFFGAADAVQDNWQIAVGAQITPRPRAAYFSRVVYRFGFNAGPDYIKVGQNLPQVGGSIGFALPITNYNRQSPNQFSVVNLSLEYGKRGNNSNLLKENIFRISLGLNFTDLWFGGKVKYD